MDYGLQGAPGVAPYNVANLGESLNEGMTGGNIQPSFLSTLLGALGNLHPALKWGGAALGLSGLAGLFGKSSDTPEKITQISRFTPQQQNALNQVLQQALSGKGIGPSTSFAPIAQQARTQFAQQTVPGLAERFTQMGGSGTRLGSSGFGQALSSAGAGLEQGLAAQQQNYNMDQQKMLMSLLGLGLTPQYDTAFTPAQKGEYSPGAQSLLSSLPLLGLLGGK